ncbi:Hypothetical predicted protein [Olea europaea subsp. europaea]|uniref:Uncharacterized protein n=1 Tax=Olea europaea subsp. europaea TaxID=158383 RepID=A0A8S0UL49_OLEEU|nr:Hypothetical predicted protein [Olea europaea subsp. europaea]
MGAHPGIVQQTCRGGLDSHSTEEPLEHYTNESQAPDVVASIFEDSLRAELGGRIKVDDWLWEQKIKENPKYGKFRYNDNSEIFYTYGKLFGATQDSTKYALTPMKLSQHDLDVSSDCDAQADFNDMLLINAKTTDSCDGPVEGRLNSLMDIFVGRSGEKRRGKQA